MKFMLPDNLVTVIDRKHHAEALRWAMQCSHKRTIFLLLWACLLTSPLGDYVFSHVLTLMGV